MMEVINVIGGWGNLISWILGGIFGWIVWSLRRQFPTHGMVKAANAEIQARIDAHDKRILVLERTIGDLPGKVDALAQRVAALDAGLIGISHQIERVSQQVNMLLRHEMEDGRK